MAISNQGYRRDLNLQETINDTVALDNLAGAGTADDISYLQNNLRNTSNIAFNKIDSNGFFSFATDRLISASAIKLSKINFQTYNVKFKNAIVDESGYAKEVADAIKSDHHQIEISVDDVLSELEHLNFI